MLNDLLSSRKQRVLLNWQCWTGVPQGFILVLLLFLVYVNDLQLALKVNVSYLLMTFFYFP